MKARKEDLYGLSRALVLILYAESGFTALVYQMLWTRYLKLVFGSTSLAVTTIVASFMAGLALGSYFFGKKIDSDRRPLRLYGIVEIGIGLYALLFPVLFGVLQSLYLGLPSGSESNFLLQSFARFVLSFGFLFIPTFLMGGTFPIICKFYVRKREESGRWSGRLYGANTFGAVLGVVIGALYFPLWFGLRDAVLITGLINLLIGFFAYSLSSRVEPMEDEESSQRADRRRKPGVRLQVFSAALFLSGLAALSYEILWVRVLSFILGASIYSFSLILAVYLCGIALGSWFYSSLFADKKVSVLLFALIELAIGLLAVLTLPFVDELPYWVARYVAPLKFSFLATQIAYAALVTPLILLATLLMGATIPCAIQIVSSRVKHLGKEIGLLYGSNTIGSIIGAFLTGFLLIPALGLQASFALMAVVNMSAGLLVLVLTGSKANERRIYIPCAVAFSFLLFFLPSLDQQALTRGTFLYASRYSDRLYNRELFEHARTRDRLLFYQDGLSTTVAVLQSPRVRYLTVNAKIDASNSRADMSTQTLLGSLPLLLHGRAKNVAIIGLGSGVTLSSTLDFPVKQVTQIEIEEAMIEAARYFSRENRNVLDDPRAKIVIEDGRNYLLAHEDVFDVIISEPSNPWMAGVANLFSKEHFETMKERLAPGGLICQWLHLYYIRPEDVRMIMRTFALVFPEIHVFQTSPGDILLMGFKDRLSLNFDRLESLLRENPEIIKRLKSIGLDDPFVLLEWSYRMDGEGLTRFIGGDGRIHSDDRPYLEFTAPRSLHDSFSRGILREMARHPAHSLVKDYFTNEKDLGRHYLRTARLSWSWDDPSRGNSYLQKTLQLIPDDPDMRLELAKIDFRENRTIASIRRTREILERHPRHEGALFHLAQVYDSQNLRQEMKPLLEELLEGSEEAALWSRLRLAESEHDPVEKFQWLQEAFELNSTNLDVLLALAEYFRRLQDFSSESRYLKKVLEHHPNYPPAYVRLAELALDAGDHHNAKTHLLTALTIQPRNARAHALLAKAYLALDESKRAYEEYLQSMALQ